MSPLGLMKLQMISELSIPVYFWVSCHLLLLLFVEVIFLAFDVSIYVPGTIFPPLKASKVRSQISLTSLCIWYNSIWISFILNTIFHHHFTELVNLDSYWCDHWIRAHSLKFLPAIVQVMWPRHFHSHHITLKWVMIVLQSMKMGNHITSQYLLIPSWSLICIKVYFLSRIFAQPTHKFGSIVYYQQCTSVAHNRNNVLFP